MSSTTYFLEVSASAPDATNSPNYVSAQTAGFSFSNESLPMTGSLTTAESQVLVNGGVATAVAEASATFSNDPNFTALFTSSEGIGIDGDYAGTSQSQARVVGTFDVSGGQTLSLDFSTGFDLTAKEIEDPNSEYNRATAKAGFLVLDTSKDKPRVLGYYGIRGNLVSSQQKADVKEGARKGARRNITIQEFAVGKNIDGNDGLDLLSANVSGNYTQSFKRNVSEVTLVQITDSVTKFSGDTLIGHLNEGVSYGSVWADRLRGNRHDNYFYGSLGNDKIRGKQGDDILEGGSGADELYGNLGNDSLHGGDDDDILNGGRGSDRLVGGSGADHFVIDKLRSGEIDTILDFEIGFDRLKIPALGQRSHQKLIQKFFDSLTDTPLGAQYEARTGGQLLFSGVSVAELKNADTLFA